MIFTNKKRKNSQTKSKLTSCFLEKLSGKVVVPGSLMIITLLCVHCKSDSNLVCQSDKDLNEIVGPTECANPIAPDLLQLSCSATYNGNFPPQMKWRKVDSQLQSNETNCGVRGNRIMCNATLKASLYMDGSVYICQIITAEQYNCSLKVNKTIYTFSDTSVRAITTTEEALCSANTSMDLPCSYRWYKDNKTEHVNLGQTLKPSNPGIYYCEAECTIRNETCAFTAMVINASEPGAVESSTVTRITCDDLEKQSTTVWYFISISLFAALAVFFIIIIVLVVALCFRFKKKLSAACSSVVSEKVEVPIGDGDNIAPYASNDNYDRIDDGDLSVSFPPRKGPLPTPGLTNTEPTAPAVCSRIDTDEAPVEITPRSRDMKVLATMGTILEKQFDDSEEDRKEEGNQPYLELFDAANPETISEKHVDDIEEKINEKGVMDSKQDTNQTPVHPYMELFDVEVADNPEQLFDHSEECKITSDCDIPSSYLTVNF